ncbi:MAG: helix-turn-helix transcriptional regulator [Anaerolineae bacterium]
MQESRQQILETIKVQGQATIDQLAKALQLKPITIRHHVALLEGEGFITSRKVRGKVGRPYLVFSMTEKGNELFPKSYHLLASRLLAKVKELEGEEKVRSILQDIGKELADTLGPEIRGNDPKERVSQVIEHLAKEGYLIQPEEGKIGYILRVYNCPYRYVAHQHPEICELDQILLQELLGKSLKRRASVSEGDPSCVYALLVGP